MTHTTRASQLAEQISVYADFFRPRGAGLEFPSSAIGHCFDHGTSDGYKFFLKHVPALQAIASLAHNPRLDENIQNDTFDEYWKARDICTTFIAPC